MSASKDMVDALRMARWREWERMATELPKGQHILSVELLRVNANQTAVVLTIARNGRLAQYELRGDAKGQNPRPVITRRDPRGCDDPQQSDPSPRVEAFAAMEAPAALAGGGDDGSVANGMPLGSPPDKEPPDPGVIAAGSSLLQTTFDLSEHAVHTPPT